MGTLTKHASNVPLLLNPETGDISLQYHMIFDDWFATTLKILFAPNASKNTRKGCCYKFFFPKNNSCQSGLRTASSWQYSGRSFGWTTYVRHVNKNK
jgi:hypothetical protein